ncbi:MAG TPA: NAD(P)H-dependent oxidoreductase, partial [Nevskiaceae bacterium]
EPLRGWSDAPTCALVDLAQRLVFVYPTWWGSAPALLKALLDRIVTPGFAFHFRGPDKLIWDRLWNGKTSQTTTTMDTPPILHRWLCGQPGTNALRRATFGFFGVREQRALMFGPVRLSSARQHEAWRGMLWGVMPWAALLVLLLLPPWRRAERVADRRIDGVQIAAMSYILWFILVPLWNPT